MMAPINDREKEQIRQWGRGRGGEITLRYTTTSHALDESFNAFARQMAELVPGIRLKKDGDAAVDRPALFIGDHVAYQALPLERELDPFLTFLGDGEAFADRIAPEVRKRLVQLGAPALVKVYITPHCPFCPATVSTLLGLAACSDQVRLTIIDGELFPGAAQSDGISAAPTVILDDQFRWTGSVDAAELVALMLDRDPASLGADALRGMIEDGNAGGVAMMMAQRKKIFPAFLELLVHPRWSVRLGAMVAFETLVEDDPGLAAGVVGPLVAVFADVDDMVKGDLIHVIGESGNKSALAFLATVATGDYDEEVRAAAGEAIEKLK
jgi:alkyl hydroperoxide reductase subunit AhpF